MNAENWQQVKTIFGRALEHAPEVRSEFLRGCRADHEVLREVKRLLAEHDSTSRAFLPSNGFPAAPLVQAAARGAGEAAPDPRIGAVLGGRYAVARELGRGGNSIVYLAHDRQMHGKPVVVKMLQDHLARNEWLRGKFRNEVEALTRISHPGVVSALDVVAAEDGRDCLVMEFVAGTTLRAALADGPLAIERLARLMPQIGDALQAAHSHGVLHRDLKPENIMLLALPGGEEAIKLIDFGIAKLENPDEAQRTDTTVLAGTTTYMSPEQLMGKPEAASDIYALAVVAYEAVTGKRPFYPATPFQLFEMQKTSGIPDPRALRPELGPRAALCITKSLSFRAADRHATAIEFCREVAAALMDPALPVPRRFSRRALIAGSAVPIAGAAAGFLWYRESTEPPAPIEFLGGQSEVPLVPHRDVRLFSEYNAARTGYDTSRLVTASQGDYYWRIAHGAQRTTLRRGWRLTLEGEAKRGLLFAQICFFVINRRWDLCLRPDARGGQTVFLSTRIGNTIEGIEYQVPGPFGTPHVYSLVAAPNAPTATLLVDGVECLKGYAGHSDYVEDRGFQLGVSSYLSANGGEGWVRRARFEAA